MWRLALVLAVVAGCCDACPEYCECHELTEPDEDLAVLTEATCLSKTPRLHDLAPTTRRLRILDVEDNDEIRDFLEDLANVTGLLPYLDEFQFTNCSLNELNASSWHSAMERIRVLNISHNRLTDLDRVLRSPNPVNVSTLTILDASDNLVNELSDDSLQTLGVLARLCFKRNEISLVNERAFFGLGLLEDLDLSDNRLVSLPDNALTPLESLQKLDLSGNQLQVLGAGWFESLGRLRELDVSRNGLARAASGALQPLPGLSVLRLAGNPLRERDVSLLLGTGRKLETVDASRTGLIRVPAALTRSVRALRLAGNKLTSIRGGDLDSYPLLRLLDMSDNRLTDVEEDALGRLEVLEDLDLSGNRLTEVPRSLPGSLTALNLEGNVIKILRFNDLQGLYSMRKFLLGKNQVKEIQEGALSQLPALEVFDISDNPVKELPANTLNGPTRLNTLKMSGLVGLQWNQREQGDMTFPVPGPERLVDLDVSRSPVLAAQLLADTAALSACKSLVRLNLGETNLTTIRSDLIYFVPQLRVLGLGGNPWICTEDLYWLGDWARQHEELEPPAECAKNISDEVGIYLRELPSPPTPASTSTSSLGSSSAGESLKKINLEDSKPTESNGTSSSFFDIFGPQGSTEEDYLGGEENVTLVELSSTEKQRDQDERSRGTDDDDDEGGETEREAAAKVQTQVYSTDAPSTTKMTETKLIREDRVAEKEKISIKESHRLFPPQNQAQSLTVWTTTTTTRTTVSEKTTRLPRRNKSVNKIEERSSKKRFEVTDGSANTVAEELSGRATDSGARISEALSAGAHPGMLVLVGAALGAVAALSVVLSRRATARRRDCCYQRQENIEVHTLTPVTELW